MSTSSVSSSSTGYLLSTTGSTPQITGLASGLDTNSIITELMSINKLPETALQNQVTGLTAENTQLKTIQTALAALASDAQALGDPSLFNNTTQAATSSDTTRVSATTVAGAAVGGYQVSVSQLANSAQRTYSFATPLSADTVTIDGKPVAVTAGETMANFVNSINTNKNLDVYAAQTNTGTLVLSNRATGNTNGSFISVQDSSGTLTEQTALAKDGQNAMYTVDNGTAQQSASNTVTGAIPGVTLNLTGVTTTSGPVTIDVSPPGADNSGITTAVNNFVTQYNSVIGTIQTQLSQTPTSSDPTQGTLYNDSELSNALSTMRTAMITSGSSLASTMANLTQLGITTGATTGAGAPSQSALNGDLSLNSSTLTNALSTDPTDVQALLSHFALTFSFTVNNEAAPGGNIDQRISGDRSNMTQLNTQITNMQAMLTQKQTDLTNQFAQMEAALSSNQSTASWLTSQIAALP
jgi:flagellar hook-associated protein 2